MSVEEQVARQAKINKFWDEVRLLQADTGKVHGRAVALLWRWQTLLQLLANYANAAPGSVEAEMLAQYRQVVPEEADAMLAAIAGRGAEFTAAIEAADMLAGGRYFGVAQVEE